jgi:hypothetical protein
MVSALSVSYSGQDCGYIPIPPSCMLLKSPFPTLKSTLLMVIYHPFLDGF